MLKLVPDYYFEKFSDANVDFLLSLGIKGVLLDVDNTLEPYENTLPGEHVKAWISALKSCGIGCAIVSNNDGKRIELFNSELSLPAYYKAKKPLSKNLKRALSDLSVKKEEAIFIGDQIFTDVLAARLFGIRSILVPPIKDKTDPFTRFKRLLERPILKRYNKIHKK